MASSFRSKRSQNLSSMAEDGSALSQHGHNELGPHLLSAEIFMWAGDGSSQDSVTQIKEERHGWGRVSIER